MISDKKISELYLKSFKFVIGRSFWVEHEDSSDFRFINSTVGLVEHSLIDSDHLLGT